MGCCSEEMNSTVAWDTNVEIHGNSIACQGTCATIFYTLMFHPFFQILTWDPTVSDWSFGNSQWRGPNLRRYVMANARIKCAEVLNGACFMWIFSLSELDGQVVMKLAHPRYPQPEYDDKVLIVLGAICWTCLVNADSMRFLDFLNLELGANLQHSLQVQTPL